jgi:hypothetical protein
MHLSQKDLTLQLNKRSQTVKKLRLFKSSNKSIYKQTKEEKRQRRKKTKKKDPKLPLPECVF